MKENKHNGLFYRIGPSSIHARGSFQPSRGPTCQKFSPGTTVPLDRAGAAHMTSCFWLLISGCVGLERPTYIPTSCEHVTGVIT
jgi:hypothetical protein